MLIIQTLTWNKCDSLIRLKDSLIPALKNIEFKWFIKDNGSTDNTTETVSKWENNTYLIKYSDNNQNFSEGMNYIFQYVKPQDDDHILLLNNDVFLSDTVSITNMLNLFTPGVGCVGAKLLYTGTNKIQHAGIVFSNKNNMPINYRRGENDDEYASKNREFQAITGAMMLLKASDYKQICTSNKSGINGMCEDLKWCYDDVDAALAIKYKLNKKIIYCGETKIFHDESASLKNNPVNKLYMGYNVNYFMHKWFGKYQSDFMSYATNKNYKLYTK